MGHVRKVGTGRWQARYRAPDGRERARNFGRKLDAERFLATVEADKLRGGWVDPRLSRITVAEWTARWLAAFSHLKPTTRAGYESALRVHVLPRFGRTQLQRLRTIDIREWVADLEAAGLSPSTIRKAHQVLGAALKAAVADDYLPKNPALGVKLPRVQMREMLFIDASQVSRLAETMGAPYDTLVHVLAYGGLRWGEAAALRRRRVDVLRARLDVVESLTQVGSELHWGPTKTYQQRKVALPSFLRDQLAEHLNTEVGADPEALVFTSPEGAPLRNTNFRRRYWLPAAKAAGMPEGLRIHDMRHTCVALLIAQGAHPKAIQAHLGHSSITVTLDRYGHLFPSEFETLAQRLDAAHREASGAVPQAEAEPVPIRRGPGAG